MDDPLVRLVDAVSDADDLESLTRPMLELLEAVTGLESTYLTTIDQSAGQQRILFSRNSKRLTIPEGLSVPWGDTLCKRAMEEDRPYTDNVAECWGDSDAAKALSIKTYLSQPVCRADGSVYGTLCAASADSISLRTGAIDVLAKFAKLLAQQVERERALRQAKSENAELTAHAMTDPLTGLANRRGMEAELKRMLAKTERDGSTIAVAFIDLDGFKSINDTYGHDVGDQFLIHIARKLTAAMRPSDLVARAGGDEFIALAYSDPEDGLRERLENATIGPFSFKDCNLHYGGASVGLTRTSAGNQDISAILKDADAAMYKAKRARKAART